MKKGFWVGVVLIGLLALAKRFGPKVPNVDWEKRLERMPDNAPPKWMFGNITTIRENTDRILEILDEKAVVEEREDVQ